MEFDSIYRLQIHEVNTTPIARICNPRVTNFLTAFNFCIHRKYRGISSADPLLALSHNTKCRR